MAAFSKLVAFTCEEKGVNVARPFQLSHVPFSGLRHWSAYYGLILMRVPWPWPRASSLPSARRRRLRSIRFRDGPWVRPPFTLKRFRVWSLDEGAWGAGAIGES